MTESGSCVYENRSAVLSCQSWPLSFSMALIIFSIRFLSNKVGSAGCFSIEKFLSSYFSSSVTVYWTFSSRYSMSFSTSTLYIYSFRNFPFKIKLFMLIIKLTSIVSIGLVPLIYFWFYLNLPFTFYNFSTSSLQVLYPL